MKPIQTIDTNHFSITINKMKGVFAEKFERFKTNACSWQILSTKILNIDPIGIDAGSLRMQLLDLKTKHLWSGMFTELKSKFEELVVHKNTSGQL